LRGADGEVTAPNHVAQMRRIVGQILPINLSRIIDTAPLVGMTPLHECLPAITVRLDGA
jgi:hypothetical protein